MGYKFDYVGFFLLWLMKRGLSDLPEGRSSEEIATLKAKHNKFIGPRVKEGMSFISLLCKPILELSKSWVWCLGYCTQKLTHSYHQNSRRMGDKFKLDHSNSIYPSCTEVTQVGQSSIIHFPTYELSRWWETGYRSSMYSWVIDSLFIECNAELLQYIGRAITYKSVDIKKNSRLSLRANSEVEWKVILEKE